MFSRKLTIFLLISMLMISSLDAKKWRNPKIGPEGGFPGAGIGWMGRIEELNLSDEQIEKIDKIRTDMEKDIIMIGAELKKEEIELREELRKDEINEKVVKDKVKKINELRGKIFERMTMARIEGWKILTAEQKKTARKFIDMGPRKKFHIEE